MSKTVEVVPIIGGFVAVDTREGGSVEVRICRQEEVIHFALLQGDFFDIADKFIEIANDLR